MTRIQYVRILRGQEIPGPAESSRVFHPDRDSMAAGETVHGRVSREDRPVCLQRNGIARVARREQDPAAEPCFQVFPGFFRDPHDPIVKALGKRRKKMLPLAPQRHAFAEEERFQGAA